MPFIKNKTRSNHSKNDHKTNGLKDLGIVGFMTQIFQKPEKIEKKTSKNRVIYFGNSRKPIPTRTSFNKRKQMTDQNYVPNREFGLVVKDMISNLSIQSLSGTYNNLKSGKYLREIKFWLLKYVKLGRDFVFDRTTQVWLVSIFVICIVSYFSYISTFSTDFLVKNYTFSFSSGSFVDKTTTQKIVQNFNKKSLFGVIPSNHFWFLNNQTLTAAAKEIEPTITNVELTGKYWPNNAQLKITTEPILTTLKINSDYYLISYSGKIIGQDYGGFRKKIVIVQAGHKNVDQEQLTKVFAEVRPDSSVGNNQLNRLYFIDQTLPKLQEKDLKIARAEIKTLFERDTDVFFITENETKILFDGLNITSRENMERLSALLETTQIGDDLRDGKIDYIDLRIQGRIYVCYKGKDCQVKTSN